MSEPVRLVHLVALVLGVAIGATTAPSRAQEIADTRLRALEAESRGHDGCGEPQVLAAIALYRRARVGTVLRARLASFIDQQSFFALACRGEIGIGGRAQETGAHVPTADEVSARARPLLEAARTTANCTDVVAGVTELLAALDRRTGHALAVLTSLADEELNRLDHCERAHALPAELGRVRLVIEGERAEDPTMGAVRDAIVPEVRALFRGALVDAPTLTGRLEVTLELEAGGAVAHVRLGSSEGLPRRQVLDILHFLERLELPLRDVTVLRARFELTP